MYYFSLIYWLFCPFLYEQWKFYFGKQVWTGEKFLLIWHLLLPFKVLMQCVDLFFNKKSQWKTFKLLCFSSVIIALHIKFKFFPSIYFSEFSFLTWEKLFCYLIESVIGCVEKILRFSEDKSGNFCNHDEQKSSIMRVNFNWVIFGLWKMML